ncbi:hypothetical protein DFH09DRAFT_1374124 [Mycena vulgaris]|nr:hypothetical protein DFH09DRAFT_1378017 [Mycena vulgaris]KAJ6514042.1 hypothetical protein DFH09DRAFT_1374124 [Mycena vulgaris]
MVSFNSLLLLISAVAIVIVSALPQGTTTTTAPATLPTIPGAVSTSIFLRGPVGPVHLAKWSLDLPGVL